MEQMQYVFIFLVSPVWTPIKFDEEGLKEVISKFFSTLKNTYTFFAMYANTDGIDVKSFNVSYQDREEIDKWLLSKYHTLVKRVTESYENYDLTTVVRSVTEFVSEDLSNWYIRRNRRRFWKSDLDTSKKAVYQTTYEILVSLSCLIAPIASFTAEDIYQKLTGNESVHLADFPIYEEKYVNPHIEKRMDLVRDLIRLGRNAREESKIKVRQPLKEVLIDGKNEELISDLLPLIEEELNVKKVVFTKEVDTYMNYIVKPNFKLAGPLFGSKIKLFASTLDNLSSQELNILQNDGKITIKVDEQTYTIGREMVDIRVSAKEGFNALEDGGHFIILNTELTESLIFEGIAREMVSKVQQLRKQLDFDIADRITLYYDGDEIVEKVVDTFEQYIKNETLATAILKKSDGEKFDLNGHETILNVEKISK